MKYFYHQENLPINSKESNNKLKNTINQNDKNTLKEQKRNKIKSLNSVSSKLYTKTEPNGNFKFPKINSIETDHIVGKIRPLKKSSMISKTKKISVEIKNKEGGYKPKKFNTINTS